LNPSITKKKKRKKKISESSVLVRPVIPALGKLRKKERGKETFAYSQ
jgi:hypothetical protein